MLDVRPTAYITPLAEQVLNDITPVIQVTSIGDEDARVTGLVKIYRQSTDQLLYTSELATTIVTHGTTINIAALSAWSPPAPADDDYFIMVETLAISLLHSEDQLRSFLGAWHFDIKPGPMGPAPAAHADTHQDGGMDEIDLTGLSPLNLYQLRSEKGQPNGYPDLNAATLVPTAELGTGAPNGTKYLRDDQSWQVPPAHAQLHDIDSIADHTSGATPGRVLQADANGLPVDATNTDAEVAAAVTASHARQHAITTTDDHTSTATPGQILKANANGLPVDATNTDTQVAGAVSHVGATTDPHGSTLTQTVAIKTPKIHPAADSTTAIQILKADGTTPVINVDTTNQRIGIGTTSPAYHVVFKSSSYAGFAFDSIHQNWGVTFGPGGNFGIFAELPGSITGGFIQFGGSARGDFLRNAIAFGANNAETMRIDGTFPGHVVGYVGIGTNTPTAKLDINSDIIRLRTAKTPASADAAGNAGDICWDADYIYVCVAANTWKRAAIATW